LREKEHLHFLVSVFFFLYILNSNFALRKSFSRHLHSKYATMTANSKPGKVVSIMLFNCKDEKAPTIVTSAMDLGNYAFYKRGSAKEIVTWCSREVTARTPIGGKLRVKNEKIELDFICHTQVTSQRLGGAVITEGPYNQRVAFALLSKALELADKQYGTKLFGSSKDTHLEVDGLSTLLSKYQNPDSADPLLKIDKDLKETKEIMLQNVEKILERGEKIEDLVQKTSDLSDSSKLFVKQAEKLNRCCVII